MLIVIGKLTVGGAEKVGRDIGLYADKDKFEIHYLVFGDEIGVYESELQLAGCVIHHIDPPSSGYLRYCYNIRKLLVSNRFDVIHSHTMFSSGWVMLIGHILGIPVRIAHSHSIQANAEKNLLKRLYENAMRGIIVRHATVLAACGDSAGKWLYGEKVYREKGVRIYNGIALDDFHFSETARTKIRSQYDVSDSFVIGHAGHLAEVKNQTFIIDLMPEMTRRNPKAVFLMLGDGVDRKRLEERASSLGVSEKVFFTGNVSNVGEYLSAMDVFVFPSLYEGMPLALIEAQANGLPCVISDRIPDDVCVTDLISKLPLKDPDDKWVQSILSSERLGADCYGSAMKQMGFDTPVMLEKIYELYEG